MTNWPFDSLRPLAYDGLIADPPWEYRTWSERGQEKAPQKQYRCMPLAEIQALPVTSLLRGDGIVLLWATFPMIAQGIATLDAWGCRYVTGGAWHKKSQTGTKTTFGTGYCLRSACEPFLIGAVGRPRYGRSVRNLIEAPVRGHSRKPDDQYRLLEALLPRGLRFAELFARQPWQGGASRWDSWGNEVHRFEAAA